MLFQFKSEEVQERIVKKLTEVDKTLRNMSGVPMNIPNPSLEAYLDKEHELNIKLKACYLTKTVFLTQYEVVELFNE